MPIFFPVLLVAPTIFLQIAREKEEDGDDAGLQITIVEPLLGLRQVAEHDGDDRQCLAPVYPIDSFFHTAKIIFSCEINKSLSFFLYFCRRYGNQTDRIHRCDARIHDDPRGVFAYLPFLFGRFVIGI